MAKTKWAEAIKPLLKKYKGKKHPLDHSNNYQLLVAVVLSAQNSDKHINSLSPAFFEAYPDMSALARATDEDLIPYIRKIRSWRKKGEWLIRIAQQVKADENIPRTMNELIKLPGIGRKSANVIMRENGMTPEGVIVDLHVVRVAPRLGIAEGADPKKIEQQIMKKLPQKNWGEAGMAISFLGREVCRPTNPKHEDCVMNAICRYYKHEKKG